MQECDSCGRNIKKQGMFNHLLTCSKRKGTKLDLKSAAWEIILILMRVDYTWLLPDMTLGGWLLRLFIIYPLVYIFGYRLLIRPLWDFVYGVYYTIVWVTMWWDKAGFVPTSIPREHEAVAGGPTVMLGDGFRWFFTLLNNVSKNFVAPEQPPEQPAAPPQK